jgi:flagellar motor switch protein FliM
VPEHDQDGHRQQRDPDGDVETFARLAGSSLSAYLRTPASIDMISLEQVPYEEYLRSINQSAFTIMSLPPLTGQAVLEVEFSLIFSIIDRMLGGMGKSISRNNLTDIERPLIRQIIERMFAAFKAAWEGVVIVNPGIEGMETSAQFVQIAPPSDIVVTILFEVKVGTQRGAMSLCIPYLVLKPITQKLSAQKWFAAGTKKQSTTARRLLSYQVNHVKVDCAVELGRTKLSMQDFVRLKEGDVLRLDRRSKDDIAFNVGGLPKYGGRPAMNGRNLVYTVSGAWQE